MKRWAVLTLGIVVAGCAHEAYPPADGPSSWRASTNEHEGADHDDDVVPSDPLTVARARSVVVVPQNSAGCESEALGLVDVHEGAHTEEQALDILRRKAAALGAEKVIGVEFHHGEAGEEPTHLSGVAVRCRDLLQARRYDVVGKLDVAGRMGHEQEALAELRSRASAMHADLILGIEFEHGEGEGKPTHVTGTAIRFTRN
jgi:uncharacterized protein YbjQ (UPF0145 family)